MTEPDAGHAGAPDGAVADAAIDILAEGTTLRAPTPNRLERFGASVAAQGHAVLVGAPGGASSPNTPGSAYFFEQDARGVYPPGKPLAARQSGPGDDFGYSVAMKGSVMAVGAPFGREEGLSTGTAFIFERQSPEGVWEEQARLVPEVPRAFGFFGVAVATDGTRVAVGGFELGKRKEGAVQVYVKREGTWVLEANLSALDSKPYAQFGVSVAISGDTLLVGAGAEGEKGIAAGAVYVFVHENGQWAQQDKLMASQGDEEDYFGYSVALQGHTAVIGAHLDEVEGASTGAVYVFTRQDSRWSEQTRLLPSDRAEGAAFGISVALEGDFLVVGAYQDSAQGSGAGAVYVFQRRKSEWREMTKFHREGARSDEEFGYGVAVSETGLIVGGAAGVDTPGTDSGAIDLRRINRFPRGALP